MKRTILFHCIILFSCFAPAQTLDSIEVIQKVDSLQEVWREHHSQGQLPEMLKVAREAGELTKKELGPAHPYYARCRNAQGVAFYVMGQFGEAEALYLEAMDILRKAKEREGPDYVRSASNLIYLYYEIYYYQSALPICLELDSILGSRKRDSEMEFRYAANLTMLGLVYWKTGRFQEAEKYQKRALVFWEKITGRNHPNYVGGLVNLANLYNETRRYEAADSLFIEAKGIFESNPDYRRHPFYLECLQGMGLLYSNMGRLKAAEETLLQARTVLKANLANIEIPYYVNLLNTLGLLYKRMYRYQEAESAYSEARRIGKKIYPSGHPYFLTTLSGLAGVYQEMERSGQAEELYLFVKEATENSPQSNFQDSVAIYSELGLFYKKNKRFEEAKGYFLRVMALEEKAVGTAHPDYALALLNLGLLYQERDQFDPAESAFQQVRRIFEADLQNEADAIYVDCLLALANLYAGRFRVEAADSLFLRARSIQESLFGKNHSLYARITADQAAFFWKTGNYEAAEQHFLEAIAIREKVFGRENESYYMHLHNLAVLYNDMGRFEESDSLFNRSMNWMRAHLGKEHPTYVTALRNQANLYENLGLYEPAEALLLEAKAISENAQLRDTLDWRIRLDLGNLYFRMGEHEKAEGFFLEVKNLIEATSPKVSLQYLATLINLAGLCVKTERYEEARPFFEEAEKAFAEEPGFKEHLFYLNYKNNLAAFHMDLEEYETARPLLQDAIALYEITLGEENPLRTTALINQAISCYHLGRLNEMYSLLRQVSDLQMSSVTDAAKYLSEQELQAHIQLNAEYMDRYLTYTQQIKDTASILPSLCFDNILFRKGFLLNAASQLRRLVLEDTASAKNYEQLRALHRLLAKEYIKPLAERKKVSELENRAKAIEKELVRTVPGYGNTNQQVSWQEVQKELGMGEAAVEFVHYQLADAEAEDSTMYAALVLRPGDAQPRFVPLFEEKQLSGLIYNKDKEGDVKAQIYHNRGFKPRKRGQITGLYELIWHPIDSLLSETDLVYFSPSGLLHRINFKAIPVDSSSILSDSVRLVRLGSTRELALTASPADHNEQAILFGGVFYGLDSLSNSPVNKDNGNGWEFLGWTEKEVDTIGAMLHSGGIRPAIYKGAQATEEAFISIGRETSSPRILHIATHGFFFPDPEIFIETENLQLSDLEYEPALSASERPMIRSGLILAGGNHAWLEENPIQAGLEDGILTAFEISQMNLAGTELVVLSACETGLGDIRGYEGVYGLQRAFRIAGAKYLIMSLWQVPDLETQELMVIFYQYWLEKNMAIPEAFRSAQKEMQRKYQNPLFWAGFVLVE